jgi:hypothetical protein
MSDNEIRLITGSIDAMRISLDSLEATVRDHCIEINKKMSDVDNRVTNLEAVKPRIEKEKQARFEWFTRGIYPCIAQFLGFFLAYLLFRITKG